MLVCRVAGLVDTLLFRKLYLATSRLTEGDELAYTKILLKPRKLEERRSRERTHRTLSLYNAEMAVRNNTLPH